MDAPEKVVEGQLTTQGSKQTEIDGEKPPESPGAEKMLEIPAQNVLEISTENIADAGSEKQMEDGTEKPMEDGAEKPLDRIGSAEPDMHEDGTRTPERRRGKSAEKQPEKQAVQLDDIKYPKSASEWYDKPSQK